MNDAKNPPRVFGILLALLGAAMAIGGVNILNMGGGFYFIVVGVGVACSGALIAMGKLVGAYVYGATLLVVLIWSFIDEGTNLQGLIPRITLPIFFAAYIYSKNVRPRLA